MPTPTAYPGYTPSTGIIHWGRREVRDDVETEETGSGTWLEVPVTFRGLMNHDARERMAEAGGARSTDRMEYYLSAVVEVPNTGIDCTHTAWVIATPHYQ